MWSIAPRHKTELPEPKRALPGRDAAMPVPARHFVNGNPLAPPFPEGMELALFGLGCFWGAERKFWQAGAGVFSTSVGYAAGYTPNPTYEEVCTGLTGHNEVVRVVFDPKVMRSEEQTSELQSLMRISYAVLCLDTKKKR